MRWRRFSSGVVSFLLLWVLGNALVGIGCQESKCACCLLGACGLAGISTSASLAPSGCCPLGRGEMVTPDSAKPQEGIGIAPPQSAFEALLGSDSSETKSWAVAILLIPSELYNRQAWLKVFRN
jgi:hypothetical protein